MEVTKDDFVAWKNDGVTKEVFRIIRERRDLVASNMAIGATLSMSCERDTALHVGRIAAYDDILQIEYDESEETVE